ncbi:hypothetical protein U9M48_021262 [Paspalum notatum var. saurae]|uniref:Uncharacterized protein n=1 Tax=Paspalum notatum var. saurae TaxID=547442 RepID=A0AAQ3TF84_PASNO
MFRKIQGPIEASPPMGDGFSAAHTMRQQQLRQAIQNEPDHDPLSVANELLMNLNLTAQRMAERTYASALHASSLPKFDVIPQTNGQIIT